MCVCLCVCVCKECFYEAGDCFEKKLNKKKKKNLVGRSRV